MVIVSKGSRLCGALLMGCLHADAVGDDSGYRRAPSVFMPVMPLQGLCPKQPFGLLLMSSLCADAHRGSVSTLPYTDEYSDEFIVPAGQVRSVRASMRLADPDDDEFGIDAGGGSDDEQAEPLPLSHGKAAPCCERTPPE